MEKTYVISDLSSIDTPALVVYKEKVVSNIRNCIAKFDTIDKLRPHVKTHKMAEVCALMLQEGITKFKCATIAEAEMLAMTKAPDVLLAYPVAGPKIDRFLQLNIHYPDTQFSCLVDNILSAEVLSKKATTANVKANVYLDLNVGMNRTGMPCEEAESMIEKLTKLNNINIVGIHAYDGHIHDTDFDIRKNKAKEVYLKVENLRKSCSSRYKINLNCVLGGSPTSFIYAQYPNIECSPGTFVFWDWGYKSKFMEQSFEYGALVISRVISIVDAKTICLDLGHKSVAAEKPLPRVHFLNAPDAIPVSQSEEHLTVTVSDSNLYSVGTVFYGVPVHICPTAALYDEAYIVEKNQVVENWKVVARSRKIKI